MWPAAPAAAARPAWWGAQSGVAPAPDQLQRLHQELDLADAALAQLDVMAGDPRDRVAAGASAVPLCALMRCFIAWMSATAEKSSPRRQTNGRIASRNAAPERQIARHRARFDHRRALPVLAHALVVGDGGAGTATRAASPPGPAAAADRCGTRSRRRPAPPSATPDREQSGQRNPPWHPLHCVRYILAPPGRTAARGPHRTE